MAGHPGTREKETPDPRRCVILDTKIKYAGVSTQGSQAPDKVEPVLVCSGCCNRTPQTVPYEQQTLISQSWRLGSKIRTLAPQIQCLVRTGFPVPEWLCSYLKEGKGALWDLLHRGTYHVGCPPRDGNHSYRTPRCGCPHQPRGQPPSVMGYRTVSSFAPMKSKQMQDRRRASTWKVPHVPRRSLVESREPTRGCSSLSSRVVSQR